MDTTTPLKSIVEATLAQIECRASQSSGYIGAPSGFTEIDRIFLGFEKATLNIIAARPSMGKSAFIETMMLNMALEHHLSILFFSLETTGKCLVERFLSSTTSIPLKNIKSGRLSPEEWKTVEAKTRKLNEATIFVADTTNTNIDDLCKLAQEKNTKTHLDAIFVDFLQLITTNSKTACNREQEISYIIRQLKRLSKELNIPVFVTSQVNRRPAEKGLPERAPILADLRDSGAIEDLADSVLFIYRAEVHGLIEYECGTSTAGVAEVIVAKNRHGEIDTVKLAFNRETCSFIDYDISHSSKRTTVGFDDTDSSDGILVSGCRRDKMPSNTSFDAEAPF